MDNITTLVNDYLYDSKISHLPVMYEDLVSLIAKEGYDVFSYAQAKELIEFADLEHCVNSDGFTYTNGEFKAVLYRDELSSDERVFVLAHELGHIVLSHTTIGVNKKSRNEYWTSRQEEEADEFAYQLIAPLCVLKAMHVKTLNSIMQRTLLSKARSERVLGKLVSYKRVHHDRMIRQKFLKRELYQVCTSNLPLK